MPRLKQYLDEMTGVPLQSVWNDIRPLHNLTQERLGYPTQKPLALLERIINASSNPGDIVLDAFCGCGTTLVAARQLGRRFVGIDISPSSCNVMGQRLEQVCGMRQAPVSMGVDEIAGSWENVGSAALRGRDSSAAARAARKAGEGKEADTAVSPTKEAGTAARPTLGAAYYRFSNLPRSAEALRKLPGFEFENWAVLQLGEVLKHHGRHIRAQVNRAKVGDFGLDGKIYLADKVELKKGESGKKLFDAHEDYIPIQVKNKDKVGRPDIDSFAHALRRDGRRVGFFIGWEFTRDAHKEIERIARLDEAMVIVDVPVSRLIAETFDSELLALMGR